MPPDTSSRGPPTIPWTNDWDISTQEFSVQHTETNKLQAQATTFINITNTKLSKEAGHMNTHTLIPFILDQKEQAKPKYCV